MPVSMRRRSPGGWRGGQEGGRGRTAACKLAMLLLLLATAARRTEADYHSLMTFYNATSGASSSSSSSGSSSAGSWTNSSGWGGSEASLCSWFGVVCRDGQVVELMLASNGLAGNLTEATSSFGNLTTLEVLDLSENTLYGGVPSVLGRMGSLEDLILASNQLISIPGDWGQGAGSLRRLLLQHNAISPNLPSGWLTESVRTTTATPFVHWNRTAPSWLLPELRWLSLRGNQLTQNVYEAIQSVIALPSLQTLDMSDNSLTGTMDEALSLQYCGDSSCSEVSGQVGGQALSVVMLGDNSIGGSLPTEVGQALYVLDLSGNSFNESLPSLPEEGEDEGLLLSSEPFEYGFEELMMLLVGDNLFLRSSSSSSSRSSGDDAFPEYLVSGDESSTWWRQVGDSANACPTSYRGSAAQGVLNLAYAEVDGAYADFEQCLCVDGYEGGEGSCSLCDFGSYRIVGGVGEGGGGEVCSACPANSTTSSQGSTTQRHCECALGFFDALGGAGGEALECQSCPAFSRTLTTGALNVTQCVCDPGYYKVAISGSDTFSCVACPSGTYKEVYGSEGGSSACLSCPLGYFSSSVEASTSLLSACTACPMGFFSNETLASSCTACPAGTYGPATGLTSSALCVDCPAGTFSASSGQGDVSACSACPVDTFSTQMAATNSSTCEACEESDVAEEGSWYCTLPLEEDGTLTGLYLLITGAFLVAVVMGWVFLDKLVLRRVQVDTKVHMLLDDDMRAFLKGQMTWVSIFSCVEVVDLFSDLGAYAALLYTASLVGWMKILYTVVVAFALTASLHGVYTRGCIILDMYVEWRFGVAIEGNSMLYPGKQKDILRTMFAKRSCKLHVPFDRGNKYMSLHVAVQRLLSLNAMRIVIMAGEDLPFLSLNLFILMQQPELATNLLFIGSFVISIFVLGYKSTLFEKHARLQIRLWNLEAMMDTDTMLQKKAARGRRLSWNCEVCNGVGGSGLKGRTGGISESKRMVCSGESEEAGVCNHGPEGGPLVSSPSGALGLAISRVDTSRARHSATDLAGITWMGTQQASVLTPPAAIKKLSLVGGRRPLGMMATFSPKGGAASSWGRGSGRKRGRGLVPLGLGGNVGADDNEPAILTPGGTIHAEALAERPLATPPRRLWSPKGRKGSGGRKVVPMEQEEGKEGDEKLGTVGAAEAGGSRAGRSNTAPLSSSPLRHDAEPPPSEPLLGREAARSEEPIQEGTASSTSDTSNNFLPSFLPR